MNKIERAAKYYVQQEVKGMIDHDIDTGDMERAKFSVSVEASGPSSAAKSGGILAAIFGKSTPSEPEPLAIAEKPESRSDITDITEYEPVEEPVKVKRRKRGAE